MRKKTLQKPERRKKTENLEKLEVFDSFRRRKNAAREQAQVRNKMSTIYARLTFYTVPAPWTFQKILLRGMRGVSGRLVRSGSLEKLPFSVVPRNGSVGGGMQCRMGGGRAA